MVSYVFNVDQSCERKHEETSNEQLFDFNTFYGLNDVIES